MDKPILFTIGYEGKSIDEFKDVLVKNDIRLLIDVRKNAISRKPGFSKTKLANALSGVRISYIHLSDLGIESDKRKSLKSPEDYQKLFVNYKNSLTYRNDALSEVVLLLNKYRRVAIMCFERQPEMCHRHVVRDWVVANYKLPCIDL